MIRKSQQSVYVKGDRRAPESSTRASYTEHQYTGRAKREKFWWEKMQNVQKAYAKKKTAENKAKALDYAKSETKRKTDAINRYVFGK